MRLPRPTGDIELVSLVITPASAIVVTGNTEQLTVMGTYSNGHVLNLTSAVAWADDGDGAITLSSGTGGGLVTAINGGFTVLIQANIGAVVSNTCTIDTEDPA